ncbi:MAG: FixH family protein [Parasphingopyxis sp.]|uniref:FixH family protein n=1 Tax=Parasphingopyxis sp. TaxID=1920299 RepID=UPI003FA09794
MTRRFNGWHMTAILVAFFGVIVVVNMTMATFATRSFGGTVVDNSYVASQRFNDWLEAARQQDELGWTEAVQRAGDHVAITVGGPEGPLGAATIRGIATHPVGRSDEVALTFSETSEGVYRSAETLARGRWLVRIEIVRGEERKRILVDLS